MDNNTILRAVRFALRLEDQDVARVFRLGGARLNVDDVLPRMGRSDEPGAIYCEDDLLEAFLDGLIVERRGPPPAGGSPRVRQPLTNNEVLKKLRIALEMRETDVMDAVRKGGSALSAGEVRALFRAPAHRHHRPCGDQLLRCFLRGVTLQLRPSVQRSG